MECKHANVNKRSLSICEYETASIRVNTKITFGDYFYNFSNRGISLIIFIFSLLQLATLPLDTNVLRIT